MKTFSIDSVLNSLDPDAREQVLMRPLQERLFTLSQVLGKDEESTLSMLAEETEIPRIEKVNNIAEPQHVLPLRLIHEYQCLPIDAESSGLNLAVLWPPTETMDKWICAVTGEHPNYFLAQPNTLTQTITELFGVGFSSLDSSDLEAMEETAQADSEDQDAAIIRFVNEIILKAMEDRATDIHFEPQKETLQIRYRIDGELIPVQLPENLVRVQAAIISRLKIMSRLNISERRRPQDGRIKFKSGDVELDIRVSTIPTIYGESVSLRILNQGTQTLSLETLGLLPDDLERVKPRIKKPHGIILVTGPTGSGKSTTLSAFIRQIRSPDRRIITVEDPIENEMPGVNQTQVQPEVGLTFASALRSVLRQDPDVIMVGEIRDRETADIAIRASLTGHLVLSTLHTNDSAGALTRLIDMEIEPFLLASSVELVVAQRLVRRLCPFCTEKDDVNIDKLKLHLESLGIDESEVQYASQIYKAVGCDQCRGLGYKGRLAVFEILGMSDAIHALVVQRKSARVMREQAIAEGMKTLQQCAWEQVKLGNTSLDAIMRFAELTLED